jgi:DMSO/TMAO reductase YedYZ molybdopterin-dependent catalytic subunit
VGGLILLGLASWITFQCSAAAQDANPAAAQPLLTVQGAVDRPLSLNREALLNLPRIQARVRDHDGTEHEYAGVPLWRILEQAGVPLRDQLRGPAAAAYLIVQATDGYQAVIAVPELDPDVTSRITMLADTKNGQPLAGSEAPFRIVIPDEKRQLRWVRMVRSIIVHRLPPVAQNSSRSSH